MTDSAATINHEMTNQQPNELPLVPTDGRECELRSALVLLVAALQRGSATKITLRPYVVGTAPIYRIRIKRAAE